MRARGEGGALRARVEGASLKARVEGKCAALKARVVGAPLKTWVEDKHAALKARVEGERATRKRPGLTVDLLRWWGKKITVNTFLGPTRLPLHQGSTKDKLDGL